MAPNNVEEEMVKKEWRLVRQAQVKGKVVITVGEVTSCLPSIRHLSLGTGALIYIDHQALDNITHVSIHRGGSLFKLDPASAPPSSQISIVISLIQFCTFGCRIQGQVGKHWRYCVSNRHRR